MMHRAYSLLEVKEIAVEEDFHVIRGMATTPTPDRINDVIEPLGAKFAPEIPLLWQHKADKPVGLTTFGKPTKKGIPFTARLPLVKEAGALKDRIDEAIQSIKYRLVAAVSIGFRPLNDAIESIDNGGLRFLETEILELSLVTIPMNSEATLVSVKSIDTAQRAASGQTQRRPVALIKSPGVSGPKPAAKRGPVKLIPRTYSEKDNRRADQGSGKHPCRETGTSQ
jgi:HK97 family phage prohead protease